MLSDRAIHRLVMRRELIINPFNPDRLQPASYDFTLGNVFQRFTPDFPLSPVDLAEDQADRFTRFEVGDGKRYRLQAGDFVLATTKESIAFGPGHGGRLEGKSSLGRLGLTIHVTAGFFDPGFAGYPTLELVNHLPVPIIVYPGMPIAQMSVFALSTHSDRPYGHEDLTSKYQDQPPEPVLSRYHLNLVKEP
jgi:dCTP deaminase